MPLVHDKCVRHKNESVPCPICKVPTNTYAQWASLIEVSSNEYDYRCFLYSKRGYFFEIRVFEVQGVLCCLVNGANLVGSLEGDTQNLEAVLDVLRGFDGVMPPCNTFVRAMRNVGMNPVLESNTRSQVLEIRGRDGEFRPWGSKAS